MPCIARRAAFVLMSAAAVAACGGDATPLPPLVDAPGYQRLMLDTAGNLMLRRMALWVDTAKAARGDSGWVSTGTRMQMDMKIGAMSMVIDVRTEYDCAGRRTRMRSVEKVSGSVKGQPLPDSVAQQMSQAQAQQIADSTWKPVSDTLLLSTVCRRAGVPMR
jgi:hypothetical protein